MRQRSTLATSSSSLLCPTLFATRAPCPSGTDGSPECSASPTGSATTARQSGESTVPVRSGLAADGCTLLSVHTVGPSFHHEPYAQTRAFYRHVGFTPMEEHIGLEWPGPTLIFVPTLHSGRTAYPSP
jgi:hypothetical protein